MKKSGLLNVGVKALSMLGVFFATGCSSSLVQHVRVLKGETDARPFMSVRYWAETPWNVYRSALGSAPVRRAVHDTYTYFFDFLFDTVFLPMDVVLATTSDKPAESTLSSLSNGWHRLTVTSKRKQLHADVLSCEGIVPIEMDVRKGSLTLQWDGKKSRVVLTADEMPMDVDDAIVSSVDWPFDKRCTDLGADALQRGRYVLYAIPYLSEFDPIARILVTGLMGGYNGYGSRGRYLLARKSPDTGKIDYIMRGGGDRLRLIPSDDFEGYVGAEGSPVREVLFVPAQGKRE